jgi:methylmalonyl-CoA/ethylmalonyl-CoA epimerase
MYKGVDHIALAVEDIDHSANFYQKVFQLDLVMGLSYPADGVHTNLVFSLGPKNELELMGPLGNKGFLNSYLKKHGPGVHHLALEVTDIDEATRKLEANGIEVFGTVEEKGMRFTFLHPRSTLRMGMQLMQRNPQKRAFDPLIKGIDHIAVRVASSAQSRDFFLNKLGAEFIAANKDTALGCRCDRFAVGEACFHALYAFSAASSISETEGLHHIGIKVTDLEEALRHLKKFGILPLDEGSTPTSAFLPPDVMNGCLWRLVQV